MVKLILVDEDQEFCVHTKQTLTDMGYEGLKEINKK
jgi:hypothetical protein